MAGLITLLKSSGLRLVNSAAKFVAAVANDPACFPNVLVAQRVAPDMVDPRALFVGFSDHLLADDHAIRVYRLREIVADPANKDQVESNGSE